jgi:DNA polymerase (family 10)
MLKNVLVAKILNEIADILEMKDIDFKPRAYRKAARTVESLSKPIEEFHEKGKLQELPGVGESIAEKIAEIIETGTSQYYANLKAELPVDVEELISVEGMGPKTVKKLYQNLGVKTLEDLERAAKQHKIREIKGLGPKVEENILERIELAKRKKERTLLGYALPIAEELKNRLKKELDVIDRIEVAGSLRRMKPTIGDIDILVTSKHPGKVADYFTSMNDVREVLGKGKTKCSVILKNDMQADLRLIEEKSYGSALVYFTGSKDHNIELRKIAINKGYKLSEYGLFEDDEQIAGKTEKEVYGKLGMQFVPPELRENRGEIEVAQQNKLPKLIGYDDIKGDLQSHTKWSDGTQTIEEMAKAAMKLDYEYFCVSDHYGKMKVAGALNDKQLRKQLKQIEKINNSLSGIELLAGAEIDIQADGSFEVNKKLLKELDVVVASVHSRFRQSKKEMTKRLVNAMENEDVDIIGHPTGRKINQKKPVQLDMETIFEASKRTGTFLEINSFPKRLDLDDDNAKAAIEAGCKLAINTDAHNKEHLRYMRLGISVARRAWLEKKDVINTLSLKELRKQLKS